MTQSTHRVLIGLTGRKQSGKDTVFNILKTLEPEAVRLAFADPLKIELARACGVSPKFVEEHKALFRVGLQWWGTDFRRNLFGETYWTDKAEHILRAVSGAPLVVFTDVRFINEAECVKRHGGRIWRVIRDLPGDDGHASETEMDAYKADNHIINNGTLNQLRHFVGCVYRSETTLSRNALSASRIL